MISYLEEIWSVISRNKLRTFLTCFGVFWGVFMLIGLLGTGKGLENGIKYNFRGFSRNTMFFWDQRTSIPFEGYKSGRTWEMNLSDITALQQNFPEVRLILPRCRVWGDNAKVTRGEYTESVTIYGDLVQCSEIEFMDFQYGRLFNQKDVDEQKNVVAIGREVYNKFFEPGEDPVGEYIQIKGVFFRVIGMFHGSTQGNWIENQVKMPFTTFQHLYNRGGKINWIAVSGHENQNLDILEEDMMIFLKKKHGIHPNDNQAIGKWNMSKHYRKMSSLVDGIIFFVWFVGIGTLLSGVIGIGNIMIISIKERTKEIGIRKALGATPNKILTMILAESVFLTLISGYIGFLTAVRILDSVRPTEKELQETKDVFFAYPDIDFKIAAIAMALLIISGLVAGIIPAFQAVKVNPVQSLKDE